MQNALEGVLVRRAKKEPTDVILNKYRVSFIFLSLCVRGRERARGEEKKRSVYYTF